MIDLILAQATDPSAGLPPWVNPASNLAAAGMILGGIAWGIKWFARFNSEQRAAEQAALAEVRKGEREAFAEARSAEKDMLIRASTAFTEAMKDLKEAAKSVADSARAVADTASANTGISLQLHEASKVVAATVPAIREAVGECLHVVNGLVQLEKLKEHTRARRTAGEN